MILDELFIWSPLHYVISIIASLTIVFLLSRYTSRLNPSVINKKYNIFVAVGIYIFYLAIIGFCIRYIYYKDFITPTLLVIIAIILLISAIRNGSKKIVLIGVIGFIAIFSVRAIFGIILTKVDNKSPINRSMLLNILPYTKKYVWKDNTGKPPLQFRYSPVYYIQHDDFRGLNSVDVEIIKDPIDDALEEGFGGSADILSMTLVRSDEKDYVDNPSLVVKEKIVETDGRLLYSGYTYKKIGNTELLYFIYQNGNRESLPIILGKGFNIRIGIADDKNELDNFTSEHIRKEAEKIISTIELPK